MEIRYFQAVSTKIMEGLMNLRVGLVSGFSQDNPVTSSAHMGVTLERAKGIDVSSIVCKP